MILQRAQSHCRRLRQPPAHSYTGRSKIFFMQRRSRRFLIPRWADQHLGGNAETIMQAPYHANRQAALAVQDLRNARSRSDERFQVLAREALLLHAELDRLDRIGRLHWVMLGLVGIDQRCQHFETVARWRAALRAPKSLDLVEG